MNLSLKTIACFAGITLLSPLNAWAGPQIFSGSGADATTAFDAFRVAINGGSRINWDGVAVDGTDANPETRVIDPGKTVEIPVDRFRGRGAIFEDPYAVSADGFGSVNPESAGQFPAFTPNNTFVMFDPENGSFSDQVIEQTFVLPNTDIAAGTRGFGAIFVDTELVGATRIEFRGVNINGHEVDLGSFDVPVGGNGETQFLGVLFDAPVITEVELVVGTHALFSFDGTNVASFGAERLQDGIDLVVTDDFVFATPEIATAVPEPSTVALMLAGLAPLLRRKIRQANRCLLAD